MMNQSKNGYLCVCLLERTLGTEATGEFTLPDYQSEIRRILHVSETVLPPARYVGSDSVEFNGTVDYQVIYVGGDGGIYSIPLSSEYSFCVPFERGECDADTVSVLCGISAESVSTRVSGPRRLSIRSRLRPNVRIYGALPTEVALLAEVDPATVYTKQESCVSLECESALSEVISLSFSMPLTSEDMRVVSADASVLSINCERSGAGMLCRGKVLLGLLTCAEQSGEISRIQKELPFEGEIETSVVGEDALVKVRGVVSELSVSVDDSGVDCGIGLLLDALVCKNREVSFTGDVYSSAMECECETARVMPRMSVLCANASLSLCERLPLSETGIPEGAQIIDTFGSVCLDRCEQNGNKYVFSGASQFAVIYKNDGEIYCADVTLPVRYEAEGSAAVTPVCFEASAVPVGARAKAEQGELRIDAELMISADCMGESLAEAVRSVRFGERIEDRESALTVCYPAKDDTLWSVAKRYRISPAEVIGDPTTDKYVMIE